MDLNGELHEGLLQIKLYFFDLRYDEAHCGEQNMPLPRLMLQGWMGIKVAQCSQILCFNFSIGRDITLYSNLLYIKLSEYN